MGSRRGTYVIDLHDFMTEDGDINTDLRLCRFFRLSNGYWLRAQAAHDTEVAERTLGSALTKIVPWEDGDNRSRARA